MKTPRTDEEKKLQREAARAREVDELRYGGQRFQQRRQENIAKRRQERDYRTNNQEIARDTRVKWGVVGKDGYFTPKDPSISKLRTGAGTNAFYDPAHSLTNPTNRGRLVTEGATR